MASNKWYRQYKEQEENKKLVTVCSKCFRSSCWQGKLYCEDYIYADTINLPISKLKKLCLEHKSYWEDK